MIKKMISLLIISVMATITICHAESDFFEKHGRIILKKHTPDITRCHKNNKYPVKCFTRKNDNILRIKETSRGTIIGNHDGGQIAPICQYFNTLKKPLMIKNKCESATCTCAFLHKNTCVYKNSKIILHSMQHPKEATRIKANNDFAKKYNKIGRKNLSVLYSSYFNQNRDTILTFSGLQMHKEFNIKLCNDGR